PLTFTPGRLLLGYDMVTPARWHAAMDKEEDQHLADTIHDRVKKMEITREALQQLATERSARNQRYQQTRYDATVQQRQFKEGDLVLVRIDAPHATGSSKFDRLYEGPYSIVRPYKNGAYVIQSADGARDIVHTDRLKSFHAKQHMVPELMSAAKPLRSTLQRFRTNLTGILQRAHINDPKPPKTNRATTRRAVIGPHELFSDEELEQDSGQVLTQEQVQVQVQEHEQVQVQEHEQAQVQVQEQVQGQDREQDQGQGSDDDGNRTHISINPHDTQDFARQQDNTQPTISIETLPVRNLLPSSLTNPDPPNTASQDQWCSMLIKQECEWTSSLLKQVEQQYLRLSENPSANPQDLQQLWARSQHLRQYLAGLVQSDINARTDHGWNRYADAMHTYAITARLRYQPFQDFTFSATTSGVDARFDRSRDDTVRTT
ncbi:hypothetical protein BGW41_007251, partial [Actinomortierella wolfii]